jgi:arylsulfatase A-like enzyme
MLRLLFACILLGVVVAPAVAQGQGRKPNVLVIVADDLGYGDLGVHGCKDIPTPHIDSIAKNGVRCSSGYVSGPYCSPTRAGLMTGRYQQRFGHEFNPGPAVPANAAFGLSLQETTLADRLKAAGYVTGMVGKWHLGHAPQFMPTQRGFQEFYGFLGGARTYFVEKGKGNPDLYRGTQPITEKEYLTDAFAREAVAFVDRHQKEPFFLYLTFNAVHTPMEASEKYLQRFTAIQDSRRRTYAAMLSAMDDAIGNVLAKLKDTGLEENTLVFFVSDNGGPPVNSSSNGPLRGNKAQTFEGGIRVPFFVQWKGRLPAGRVYDRPVIQLDILPTAVAAAGATVPGPAKLDGVNLLPYLDGTKAEAPHEALYWRFGPQMAIRQGVWKLVRGPQGPTQLFNLASDVGEKNDLTAREPDKVRELTAAWKQWDGELAKPAWEAPRAAKKAKR